MVAEAHVFGPILRGDVHRQASIQSHLQHLRIETLRMHIELDRAARRYDASEDLFPEREAAFRNTALAVNAHGDALDSRAGFQKQRHGFPAVWAMRFGRQTLNVV